MKMIYKVRLYFINNIFIQFWYKRHPIPNENMITDEQCDFADGICNCEELSKVPLMNWRTQPQVFKKGNSGWICRTN